MWSQYVLEIARRIACCSLTDALYVIYYMGKMV